MKKILSLALIVLFCMSLTACSKDAEINTFLSEWETTTNEIAAKLETGNVDEAQKIFDGKKDSLKTKWEGVKTARGFQVSDETKKKMEASTTKNMATLTNASMKAVSADYQNSAKIQNLVKQYSEIFK